MDKKLAPIVLFTYNRPEHTQQVLDALALNNEAKESILYIYCDGAKPLATEQELEKINTVKSIATKEHRFKEVVVIEQQKNKGLANSIIDGVSEIINEHGKIIVLEDDIVTSKGFLKYMNDALKCYENNENVMHISGFMYPHQQQLPETFFYNVTLCWGWATWQRAWQYFNPNALQLWKILLKNKQLTQIDKFSSGYLSSQLAHNISGKLNTWFIKWHVSVFLKNGYTLFPSTSLVDNIGFDNTGVHNGTTNAFVNPALASSIQVNTITLKENETAEKIIKAFYNNLNEQHNNQPEPTVKEKIKQKIRHLFFKLFPDVKQAIVEVTQQNKHEPNLINSYLGANCKVYPPGILFNTIIGNYSYAAQNANINNTTIGKFCSIGPNFLCGWGIHPTNGISTHPMFYSTLKQNGISLSNENKIEETKPIVIGNDVFIGMNVIILDGVTIGDGAVIGAGSVVSKNIPPYAIAVGSPIQIKKYRFDDETIKKLLQIKWWDLPKEQLQKIEQHFFDVETFIAKQI